MCIMHLLLSNNREDGHLNDWSRGLCTGWPEKFIFEMTGFSSSYLNLEIKNIARYVLVRGQHARGKTSFSGECMYVHVCLCVFMNLHTIFFHPFLVEKNIGSVYELITIS